MLWWKNPETRDFAAVIADGAVRSGKTFSLSVGFIFWSAASFNGASFAVCGKTLKSVRRNVVKPLFETLSRLSFASVKDFPSKNYFEVSFGKSRNRYYLFGGKDSASASLIQGMTLGGLLMDEVALMPRSFVEQAIARCSLDGSKFWFNCNPDNPFHWFKREWIDKRKEKKCLYLHFSLSDNPSLSEEIISRYHTLYSGAFYRRFVLGEWCSAEGLVYPMFSPEKHCFGKPPESLERCVISVDYGTVNPTSAGLWGKSGEVWYRLSEYYFDSRREGAQRTDEEHYKALESLAKTAEYFGKTVDTVICDPSAASFSECIRRHGKFSVRAAKNDVISGIRKVSDALVSGKIRISEDCADTLREFSLYRWDGKSGNDCPIKENDHAMDDIRYFVAGFLGEEADGFCVLSVAR